MRQSETSTRLLISCHRHQVSPAAPRALFSYVSAHKTRRYDPYGGRKRPGVRRRPSPSSGLGRPMQGDRGAGEAEHAGGPLKNEAALYARRHTTLPWGLARLRARFGETSAISPAECSSGLTKGRPFLFHFARNKRNNESQRTRSKNKQKTKNSSSGINLESTGQKYPQKLYTNWGDTSFIRFHQ